MTRKAYILFDLEGVTGIDSERYLTRGSREYEQARDWATRDANAAIAGTFDGGATDVVLLDVHEGGGNVLPHRLDRRVRLEQLHDSSLDGSYTALMLVGHHAKAGTLDAFLDHTRNGPTWLSLRINGEEVGEIFVAAAYAGHFGIPLAMITGDEAACREANAVSPGAVAVPVKSALGRSAARCVPPDEARARIGKGASMAIQVAGQLQPVHIAA